MSKVDGIVNWINTNNRSDFFKIHIMGGELFQDKWIEEGFLDIYQDFINEIRFRVSLTKQIVFNFVTNLVFTNNELVEMFLENNNLKISISYDLKGRFSLDQKLLFMKNVELFKERIEMVSVVQTKQNIDALLSGKDSFYDYLYENFLIDWDSYLPSAEIHEPMMPKESELLAFYKHLVDKYPKTLTVQHFVSDETMNKMTCTRGNSYTVLFDGSNPMGCSGSVLLRDGQTEDLGSGQILENFFEKYQCFQCEYFSRCPFTCFIKADYRKLEHDIEGCVFKHTFDHAKNRIR